MIACYIIYSMTIDKFYIGITQDSITSRIEKHNNKEYGMGFTSQANDWYLFFFIECKSIGQAMNIEKHIKRMKSIKYLENLKKYPEISIRLLEKYST